MISTFKKLHDDHQGKISDKWSIYFEVWDRLFTPYRDKQIRLLEIGIQNGGSLEIWGKYFKKAKKIIGCDIDPKCYQLKFEDSRIVLVVGDANSNDSETQILQESPKFDIIIDDGSHKSSDIVKSFAKYFPHLEDGGIYIAEDLHCSYWNYFEGDLYDPHSSISFFKRLADVVNFEHWRHNIPRRKLLENFALSLDIDFDDLDLARIHSIEFINSLCVIRKLSPDKNVVGHRIIVGVEETVTSNWHKHNNTSINDINVETNSQYSDVFEMLVQQDELNKTIASKNEIISSEERQISSLKSSIEDYEGRINGLSQIISELNQVIPELNKQLGDLQQENLESGERIEEFVGKINEQKNQLAESNALLSKKDNQLAESNSLLFEKDSKIAEFDSLLFERDNQIADLSKAVSERDATINRFETSRSWRFLAPLRKLKSKIRGNDSPRNYHQLNIEIEKTNNSYVDAFFTICSKNFLAHARTLHESLQPHYPNTQFFVVLCDQIDGFFDPSQEPFEFIYLEELNLPNLREMAERYNITEFNTAVKPFAFSHLMTKYNFNSVVYLDPDLFFVDKMEELEQLLQEGAEAVLTPHILQPAENDEIHDGKMLLFGIYNLGFLALRNTPSVREFLSWWSRRLEYQCVIQIEQGLFVDQKWADLLPAFVSGTKIIHHPGYNVAYWNLPQRNIKRVADQWYSNEYPLRFVHFSGNKIDDPNIFSRHSGQVTMETIGDLRELLVIYREKVFSQGHQYYRNFPYAFNWNGQSGINLHTPSSLDTATSQNENIFLQTFENTTDSELQTSGKMLRRYKTLKDAIPSAHNLTGSWRLLIGKTWRAYRQNGWEYVKQKTVELSKAKVPPINVEATNKILSKSTSTKKRLLYIDWAIPKPDIDAASLTAVQLLKIFNSLNYEVTFIPAGLEYEKDYYEALTSHGINVLCRPAIHSVNDWLKSYSKNFDVCVLSRGPVAWNFLATLKEFAPDLQLIFNTVDLHYLRELRRAELTGDEKIQEVALMLKEQELELIKQCDLTIVLSNEELYKVREIYPQASLTVLPIIFDDIPGAINEYDERKDIIFVGSFPHLPNIDSVMYFAEQIFPLIQKQIPDVRFKIVGANPPESIQNLSNNPSIEVLGFVKDLKPLFENVKLSVAPIRYGAGIKGKIGTSFCFGVPCVATSIATEGMGLLDRKNVLIGETPEEFADAVCQVYSDKNLWESLSNFGHQFASENYSVDVIRNRVKNLLTSVDEGWKPIEQSVEIDSWISFQRHSEYLKNEYDARISIEMELLPLDGSEAFFTEGYCCICQQETKFLTSFMYSTGEAPNGQKMPNWREHMQCGNCGFVNRVRAALNALFVNAPPSAHSRIYITEQLTSTYRWLQSSYQNVQGSEYFGDEIEPGSVIDEIRNENIMNLSFPDSNFDYVISFDVLEHIPFPEKAFSEIYRVLDNNGILVFTVPFSADSQEDIIRASLIDNGEIEHHMPPEFHGNPVDPEGGALCFRYFGWELLENLRNTGFSKVRALTYWSKNQGYLGREQFVFIAEKILPEAN